MMRAVNGYCAALAVLLFLISRAASAAENLSGAAQELAHRTAAWNRGAVAATYRNLSSLPDSQLAQARREFEAALPSPNAALPPVEARITLSENAADYLLVEEVRQGEDSQVWIARWKRTVRAPAAASGLTIDKRLVWEQDEPVLDIAFSGTAMVVLTPFRITLYARQGTEWQQQRFAAIAPGKAWPRDPRGRLRVNGNAIDIYLPGIGCTGSVEPGLAVECRANDQPWVLESGSHSLLLANFVPDRNYFDGRLITQNGARKSIAPFYSAAAAEDQGAGLWLLAMLDGRTQIFDAAFQDVASIPSWGSNLVGTNAPCGGGSQVLADSPGDSGEPDAIRAYAMVNHAAVPLGPPVTFDGPVTALWPSNGVSALAIVHDPETAKYRAYVLTVACGP